MTLPARNPNTIMLSGRDTYTRGGSDNRETTGGYVASAAFTPGELIEEHDDSGVTKFRKNASATELCERRVALDKPHEVNNTGIDDDYAAGENVEWALLHVGAVWYGFAKSGETVANGDWMQSGGDGTMIVATATTADANLGWAKALDNLGAIGADTRCRFERVI